MLIRDVYRLSCILVACPDRFHFNDVYDLVFFLPKCLFFCPGMLCLTYLFPSSFVRLVLCLVGEGLWFWAVCHCLEYAWVVELCLQADSIVNLEDVAVLGESCPAGCDSSLNHFFLVFAMLLSYTSLSNLGLPIQSTVCCLYSDIRMLCRNIENTPTYFNYSMSR